MKFKVKDGVTYYIKSKPSDYVIEWVESTVLESGKVKNKIIVFPKSPPSQDFKKKSKKRKKSYEKST